MGGVDLRDRSGPYWEYGLLYPYGHPETQDDARIDMGEVVVISRGAHIVAMAGVTIGEGCPIVEYTSIRDANHFRDPGRLASRRAMVKHNPVARSAALFVKEIDRDSFGWRLSLDEKHVATALEKPILGSGKGDLWGASGSYPWELWLLAFGMYGIAGEVRSAQFFTKIATAVRTSRGSSHSRRSVTDAAISRGR